MLSPSEILNYIKVIEKLWHKDEGRILRELSKLTHLKWEEDKIFCYVVGNSIPFSDPLTIPAYKNRPTYFIDILIHELIHRLFDHPKNLKKIKRVRKYFYRKYKNENKITRNHIPLHAIYTYILLKFYNKRRLKREIELISYLPFYKRSWQIVLREGYKNIIKEFITSINK